MKTRSLPTFFVHFAAYAENQFEFLRFENHVINETRFYHEDKTSITKARGREGLHREYVYKFETLADVVKLGMCLGEVMANINNGLHVKIEIK